MLLKQGLSEEEIKHILESALREANDQQLPADIFKVSGNLSFVHLGFFFLSVLYRG